MRKKKQPRPSSEELLGQILTDQSLRQGVKTLCQGIEDILDREEIYGDPLAHYSKQAIMLDAWRVCVREHSVHGTLNPSFAIAEMVIINLVRLITDPAHEPTWANIAGYAGLGAEVGKREI